MTRDDIIRMARDAGFESHDIKLNFPKELERFANLVAAAEREACAKLCEQYETGWPEYHAETLARAIRARKENNG